MSRAERMPYVLRIGIYHRTNRGTWLTPAQTRRVRHKNPEAFAARQIVRAADRERRAP